jgi:hypothetical protein
MDASDPVMGIRRRSAVGVRRRRCGVHLVAPSLSQPPWLAPAGCTASLPCSVLIGASADFLFSDQYKRAGPGSHIALLFTSASCLPGARAAAVRGNSSHPLGGSRQAAPCPVLSPSGLRLTSFLALTACYTAFPRTRAAACSRNGQLGPASAESRHSASMAPPLREI